MPSDGGNRPKGEQEKYLYVHYSTEKEICQMYKLIDVSEVEENIKNGKEVLMADFAEEDVLLAENLYVGFWLRIKSDKSGRYVFVVKVNSDD